MKRFCTLATVVATTSLLLGSGLVGAAGAASASTAAAHPNPGGRIVRVSGNSGLPTISLNWSGYAATSAKKFRSVRSVFVQPAVKCPGVANQWTSNWVGLDGFTDQTVEQDGTFAFCGGKNHTTPQYEAWYEMFPAGSVNVFKVKPGDVIDAQVTFSRGKFHLTIGDVTTGKQRKVSATCSTCKRASAEWIIERPALCNNNETKCFLTELANFGTATMGQAKARVSGQRHARNIGRFANVPIFMIDQLKAGFISLDTVSALSGNKFAATWDRSGTITPITLGPKR